jgi:hypothetical protein
MICLEATQTPVVMRATIKKNMQPVANVERSDDAEPQGPVEKKVCADVDLDNGEDVFHGEGGNDDSKNVEQNQQPLFQQVNVFLGRVENK